MQHQHDSQGPHETHPPQMENPPSAVQPPLSMDGASPMPDPAAVADPLGAPSPVAGSPGSAEAPGVSGVLGLGGRAPGSPFRAGALSARRGKRLVSPEEAASATRSLTPEQRLLILDAWQRSALPAADFAPIAGVSRQALYAWKKWSSP